MMIAPEIFTALVSVGMLLSKQTLPEKSVQSMVQDVVDATPEPLLFPGERTFWLVQAWHEGNFQSSPKGYNDNGSACGVTQVHRFSIPEGMGTCEELRASRKLAIEASRVILKKVLGECKGVRAAIGRYMTGGKCGAAPKLTEFRCRYGGC